MNVLSLFDGMSSLMSALLSLGVKPDNYYACEIDKYSEAVSKYHYPDIIRLGDVTKVSFFGLPKIDLLVAGFPCQSFSLAGKQLNFDDPRGQLFFEVVRLIHELQPKYFLLENVRMKKEIQDEISRLVGVQPIQINSALVSAQNRVRNYWTNIPGITQPADKGILLRDILEDGSESVLRWQNKTAGCVVDNQKAATLRASGGTDMRKMQKVILNSNPSGRGMNGRVFGIDGKCGTLTTNKGEGTKIGIQQRPRGYNQGGLFTEESPTLSSNSWQDNNHLCIRIGTAEDIKGFDANKRIYSPLGKCPTLLSSSGGCREPKIPIDEVYYRKLTPLECERLQTYADNYTQYGIINGKVVQISNSQRYRMIGNGFTKDVVEHNCSFIPEILDGRWVNLWG